MFLLRLERAPLLAIHARGGRGQDEALKLGGKVGIDGRDGEGGIMDRIMVRGITKGSEFGSAFCNISDSGLESGFMLELELDRKSVV